MITHGNKQISEIVYARKASEGGGAVRLTNIIRGAQVVFGGLKPSFAWLEKATKAAILAAFGQTDGKAVIKATNAYLNALVATDNTKASALEGFINEDPMLVCSLGLQPQGMQMPIRWLVGDGTACFSTGYIPLGSDLEFGVKFKMLAAGQGNKGIFGKGSCSNQIANAIYATCWTKGGYPNLVMFGWQGKHGEWSGDITGSKYDYIWDFHYILKSGAVRFISTKDGDADKDKSYTEPINYTDDGIPMYFFKGNNAGASKSAIAFGYAKQDGKEKFIYYPCIHNGELGMADIISKTWKGNEAGSGSFSIAYTLPDGTPWTPLNQTP